MLLLCYSFHLLPSSWCCFGPSRTETSVDRRFTETSKALHGRYIVSCIRAFSMAGLVSMFFLGMFRFFSKTLPLGHLRIAIPSMWSTRPPACCFVLPELPELLPLSSSSRDVSLQSGYCKFLLMSPSCCPQDKGLSATFQLGSTPLSLLCGQANYSS